MIINGFNINMKNITFEDLEFILKDQSEETINKFINDVPSYLKPQDLFSFINFIIENNKILLEKFKKNQQLAPSIFLMEQKLQQFN